uniref:Tyrosine-protein kinase n=1 Tax=Sander lucioperca TaxID=283035 RepID=A0A8C9ZI65_SANLU
MFPRVILKGTMIKKSQQKKKTSPCNYKERFFVLDTQDLKYSERRPGVRINYCEPLIVIQKFDISFILSDIETKRNNLVAKYHPNFWMDGKWKCCQQTEKLAPGCQVYDPVGYASKKPLPQLPDPEVPSERKVIALQDYTPLGDDDLPLQKDKEYILIKSSHSDWWAVQDDKGDTGFVPSTYVAEKSSNNFQRFEWYNKNITRGEAEVLLMKQVKNNGSRDYSLSINLFFRPCFDRKHAPNDMKHYQIRQTETGEATYYLAEKYLFSTIPELIYYHQHNAAGLITRLRHPVSQDGGYQWEVHPEDLTLGQELGSGQFGLVLEGRWRGKRVAVKMIREECMSDEEFKEEARVMMRLSHCKLVQLYGVRTHCSPMCLVFEFMENGCLSDYLRARKGRLSQDTMLGMCLDVSEGMAYLELSNFLHRDLAARNCLVSKNNEVKISDFGMTRFVLDDQYTSSQCSKFPVKWSAPEVIKYCKFSSKSDVWSFGVLMWEVYNEGRLPYENRTNGEVVESLNSGLRLLKPRLAPDAVHQLMEWCWKEVGTGIKQIPSRQNS